MSEQLQTLHDVCSRLDDVGIPYMLTGSMAMNHYATPRMTRDIDLVVELAEPLASELAVAFAGDYYVEPETVMDAVRRSAMFNVIHLETIVKVDFIVRKADRYRVLEFSRRRRVDWGGTELWVTSPEDLLLSKLVWSRDGESDLQMRDVRNLADAVEDLDRQYLRQWADVLEVAELLSAVLE